MGAGRKKMWSFPVVAALAVAISVTSPAGAAHAIDEVPCNSLGFLRVKGHPGNFLGERYFDLCFRNAGTVPLNFWVDWIYTGAYDIVYHDSNGDKVRIARWTIADFSSLPRRVDSITIL